MGESLADLELRLTLPNPDSYRGTKFARLPRREITVGVRGAYFDGMQVLGILYATVTQPNLHSSILGSGRTTQSLFNTHLVIAGPNPAPITDCIHVAPEIDMHVASAVELARAHYHRVYERLAHPPTPVQVPMPAPAPSGGG